MQDSISTFLKFVPYPKFNLWDVKRYHTNSVSTFENTIRLRDILIPYRKPVSKQEMIKNKWQIISKINFAGELFLREFEEINSYKGNVNLVPENSIIYSKINVRHGCIYYHEKGKIPFGVSSEYPTYTFDENKINGKFLHRILRSSSFKKLLNTKTSGISKARVKQDEFLDIEIPLPSIKEQHKIINIYDAAIQKATELLEKAGSMREKIETDLFNELGVVLFSGVAKKTSLQFVQYNNVNRWDTLFLLGDAATIKSKYPIAKFSDVVSYFNENELNKSIRIDTYKYPHREFRYIGMEHLQKETGELVEMPIVKGKDIKSQTIQVPHGFIIYGKLRPYLNKYWINAQKIDNLVCSSEFFVFNIANEINKNFFKLVLSSKIIQNQIADKTSGARMPRINESIFLNLKFPLPPKNVQDFIAANVEVMNEKIENFKKESTALFLTAELDFEAQIFN